MNKLKLHKLNDGQQTNLKRAKIHNFRYFRCSCLWKYKCFADEFVLKPLTGVFRINMKIKLKDLPGLSDGQEGRYDIVRFSFLIRFTDMTEVHREIAVVTNLA